MSMEDDPPFIANARAGNWYLNPTMAHGSVYFKSTDGHHLNWSFSPRRLNLSLLQILGKHGCVVIVDSTRRGKVMPDALSKTIPIWAAVLNRVLFPDQPESHGLVTSPQAVGASEHAQIEERLSEFAETMRSLMLDFAELRTYLQKPMRPVFASPDMALPTIEGLKKDWNILVLVSASRLDASDADSGYVQGAADDAENWALGLTPKQFWENEQYLLDAGIGEAETERRVLEVVDTARAYLSQSSNHQKPKALQLLPSMPAFYIIPLDSLDGVESIEADIQILCYPELPPEDTEPTPPEPQNGTQEGPAIFRVLCPPGKNGSRALCSALPRILTFITETCQRRALEQPHILYACATGKDISVGVALAMVCELWGRSGSLAVRKQPTSSEHHAENCVSQTQPQETALDKTFIRQRLVQIQSQMEIEDGGPSRKTLSAVHSFLMKRPHWT